LQELPVSPHSRPPLLLWGNGGCPLTLVGSSTISFNLIVAFFSQNHLEAVWVQTSLYRTLLVVLQHEVLYMEYLAANFPGLVPLWAMLAGLLVEVAEVAIPVVPVVEVVVVVMVVVAVAPPFPIVDPDPEGDLMWQINVRGIACVYPHAFFSDLYCSSLLLPRAYSGTQALENLLSRDQQIRKECILWSKTLGKTPFVCLGHFFSRRFQGPYPSELLSFFYGDPHLFNTSFPLLFLHNFHLETRLVLPHLRQYAEAILYRYGSYMPLRLAPPVLSSSWSSDKIDSIAVGSTTGITPRKYGDSTTGGKSPNLVGVVR
ncbi:hypothetical protein Taro_009682, partial [Colocasia esculenta]|nr:hypothetical protein [Colocasia esculenta]